MIKQNLQNTDWELVANEMHQNGFAILPNLLSDQQCEALKAEYNNPTAYRKTVVMERYRFGLGEYKYFNYPLPDIIQQIRTNIYPKLASIANIWFKLLNIGTQFPMEHAELLQQCHENNQQKATVLILKYGKGGFNTLHQDLRGCLFSHSNRLVLKRTRQRFYRWRICIDTTNTTSTIQGHCIETQ